MDSGAPSRRGAEMKRRPDAWIVRRAMAEDCLDWSMDKKAFRNEPLYRRTDADRAVLLEAAENLDAYAEDCINWGVLNELAAKLREMAS